MTRCPTVSIALLLGFVVLGSGCRGPQLVSRPMTPAEAGWASVIQRSYGGWQPPFIMPTRANWRPRPRPDTDLSLLFGGEEGPAVVPSPALLAAPDVVLESPSVSVEPAVPEIRQTVVDVVISDVPSASPATPVEIVAPVRADAFPTRSAEPNVAPAKLVPEPALDDVELVPADAGQ